MKTTPTHSTSVLLGLPSWAACLIAAGLSVSMVSAQSSTAGSPGSGKSTMDRTANDSSTSPSTDSGAASMPSRGSSSGSGTSGSNYGSATTGSTAGSGYGSADRATVSTDTRDHNGTASTLKRADKHFITKAVECSDRELAASQLAAQRASDPQIRSFAQQVASEHQRMQQELAQLAQRKGVNLDHMGMTGMSTVGGQYSASAGTRGTETGVTASSDTANISGVANDHGSPRAGAVGATEGMATNPNLSGSMGDMNMNMDRQVRNLSRQSGPQFDRDYVDLIVDSHEDAVKLFQKAAKDAQDSEVRSYASSHLAALQAHLDQANMLMKSAAE